MTDVEMVAQKETAPVRADHERLKIQGDMQNATFSFYDEDHTLGNLLRNQIVKNKAVEFCAYSVPHPSEPICNVRVQCAEHGGTDSHKALKHGLKRVGKICDVLTEKFEDRLAEFKKQQSKKQK